MDATPSPSIILFSLLFFLQKTFAQNIVVPKLHILPSSAGSSAPKYFAQSICGIAKLRPDANEIPTTPFNPFKLLVVIKTNTSGIAIIKNVNCNPTK